MDSSTDSLINAINENQGVLTIALYLLSILIGWLTGIFSSLRRRPRFRIKHIDGPTFACTYGTGALHNGYDVHRTGIAIYLQIANVGSAASSVENVALGYRWHIRHFGRLWWRYRIRKFWLTHPTISLSDFTANIGNQIKIYPFLFQKGSISHSSSETYLSIGQSTNGIVYFEQEDSWGGCFPSSSKRKIRITIEISDTFGGKHRKNISIPKISLLDARKFNQSFGLTMGALNASNSAVELPTDDDGNFIPKQSS